MALSFVVFAHDLVSRCRGVDAGKGLTCWRTSSAIGLYGSSRLMHRCAQQRTNIYCVTAPCYVLLFMPCAAVLLSVIELFIGTCSITAVAVMQQQICSSMTKDSAREADLTALPYIMSNFTPVSVSCFCGVLPACLSACRGTQLRRSCSAASLR
jgi:hypothetical protein